MSPDPRGGTPEKPVGLVHYAVSSGEGTVDRKLMFPSSRQMIQLVSAFRALALVRELLLGGHCSRVASMSKRLRAFFGLPLPEAAKPRVDRRDHPHANSCARFAASQRAGSPNTSFTRR